MNEPTEWIERSSRFRIRIEGPDRHKYLHNLTTNEIKRLPDKAGCETFVTSPQGKTLGFVTIHNLGDSLLLRGDEAARETLGLHLAKYGMFDDVTITDLTDSTCEFHVFGDEYALDDGNGSPVIAQEYSVVSLQLKDDMIFVGFWESPTGKPGGTFLVPRNLADRQRQLYKKNQWSEVATDRFDLLRILAGTPIFGRDITSDNLPQEVGRDAKAISFVKGCYLGQETVARIDALGHVNKILRGLRFASAGCVAPGTALGSGGKSVGTVTSSAVDPRTGLAVGLGYVRIRHADAGTSLDVMGTPGLKAVVSEFPIPENA